MLVLSRRPNESIMIGDHVKVTVLGISPSRVDLGIEAPLHVRVDREEIYWRKRNEQPSGGGSSRRRTRNLEFLSMHGFCRDESSLW